MAEIIHALCVLSSVRTYLTTIFRLWVKCCFPLALLSVLCSASENEATGSDTIVEVRGSESRTIKATT